MKSSFDCFVDVLTCLWSEANEMFHQLALTIKNKRLRNRVSVGKQKGYEIFVRFGERVLNPKFPCECRHFLIVAWTTHVESYDDESLSFVLLLQSD